MVVEVTDKIRVAPDGPSWTTQRLKVKQDKTEYWRASTWHGTLGSALRRALDDALKADPDQVALEEAVRRVEAAADRVAKAVEATGVRRTSDLVPD